MSKTEEEKELDLEFLKEMHPELLSCSQKELRVKTREAMYALEFVLQAMIARGVSDQWWKPQDILDKIEWICEEFGWEGVGR